MRIHLITNCWNEERMLPFFLDYYTKFCDKITIFDNYSDDNSEKTILSYPKTEIIKFKSNYFDIHSIMEIRNEYYKQYRKEYDWQIIVDIDEFVYSYNLLEKLEEYKKNSITVVQAKGFEMYSSEFPIYDGEYIFDKIKCGFEFESYDKCVIFDPKIDINYEPGCHVCNPSEDVVFDKYRIKLLHYRYLGYEYFYNRNKILLNRRILSGNDRKFGIHYYENDSITENDYIEIKNKAYDILRFGQL